MAIAVSKSTLKIITAVVLAFAAALGVYGYTDLGKALNDIASAVFVEEPVEAGVQ